MRQSLLPAIFLDQQQPIWFFTSATIEDTTDDEPTQEVELEEEEVWASLHTRGRTKKLKSTFAVQAATDSQEFKSVCTRRPDGTVDMEPADLTRMCTLLAEKVSLPYRQNKQAARYHLYAKENIQLPAETAVEADLGYRIQLKPGLTVHMFAPAELTGRQISAE